MPQVCGVDQEWRFGADEAGAHRRLASKILQAIGLKPLVGAPYRHIMALDRWWERVSGHRCFRESIIVIKNFSRRTVQIIKLAVIH